MITLKAEFANEDKALWPGRVVYVVTQTGIQIRKPSWCRPPRCKTVKVDLPFMS